jgi:CTP:molybdopterin cytidylyltransferase MocA
MGDFKPLMLLDGEPMIRRTVLSVHAGGIMKTVVVLGRNSPAVTAALKDIHGVTFAYNKDFATTDMLHSIQLGLQELITSEIPHDDDALFVLPGDMPGIKPATFSALLEAARQNAASAFYPTYQTRRGHPLLLKHECFETILKTSGEGGLRAIMQNFAQIAVPTDDPGILLDADDPQALATLKAYLKAIGSEPYPYTQTV